MTSDPGKPNKGMDEELIAMLKYLRLGRLLSQWDETLETARKGRYSTERLLRYVLEEECRIKRENARLLRRQRANIPEMLEMETFPFSRQPELDRKKIMSYYDSFDYMTKQRNMVWVGPTGCGKSGLTTAFLLQAIDRGHRGYFEPGLRRMGIISAQQAPDGRLDRPTDGEKSRDQHEELQELAEQTRRVECGDAPRLPPASRHGPFDTAGDRVNALGRGT